MYRPNKLDHPMDVLNVRLIIFLLVFRCRELNLPFDKYSSSAVLKAAFVRVYFNLIYRKAS